MRKLGPLAGALALLGGTIVFANEIKTEPKVETTATSTADAAIAKDIKKDLVLEFDGDIYPKKQFPENCGELLHGGKCDAKPLGTMHLESKKEGTVVYSKSTFSDAEMLQVTEESWEEDGHVLRVSIDNNVQKKVFELEVKDNKVFYKITDKVNGSVKTSVEDAEADLVVPSTILSYIGNKLGDLAAGKEVKVKVAAIDHQEAFTFTLKKYRMEKTLSGDPVMVLELKAKSFFVRSVVDPMFLYIGKDGELVGFEGKSPLRQKDGDKYKELTVRVGYHYVTDLLKPNFQLTAGMCDDTNNKTGMTKCEIPGAPTSAPAASSSIASPTPQAN